MKRRSIEVTSIACTTLAKIFRDVTDMSIMTNHELGNIHKTFSLVSLDVGHKTITAIAIYFSPTSSGCQILVYQHRDNVGIKFFTDIVLTSMIGVSCLLMFV